MKQKKATIHNITSPGMVEVCKVIDKWADERYPVFMEDYVNYEHKDSIRKYLVGGNYTKENNEVRSISINTHNKIVIHRYITRSETE